MKVFLNLILRVRLRIRVHEEVDIVISIISYVDLLVFAEQLWKVVSSTVAETYVSIVTVFRDLLQPRRVVHDHDGAHQTDRHEEEPDDHVLDPLQVRDTGKGQLQEDAREAGHGLTTRA